MSSPPRRTSSKATRSPGRSWLTPPRQLALTTPGKYFVLMTLAVGFGALNTGNNLLFLLLGMMLSLIVASGLLSEAVLRALQVRRELPRRLYAGESAPGRFLIQNAGRWPSLSIEISEHDIEAIAGPLRGTILTAERPAWWKLWRPQTSDDHRPLAAAYCLRADAGQETTLTTHYTIATRGIYRLKTVQIATRFPFGFFEKARELPRAQEITVYPRSRPTPVWLSRLRQDLGDTPRHRLGQGEDFFGLRDYRDGADQRAIHWKSSARRSKPLVREREANDRRDIALVLDPRAATDQPDADERRRFERGIEHLAGLLEGLVTAGFRVQLLGSASAGLHPPASESQTIDGMLAELATVELLPASSPGPATPPVRPGQPSQAILILGLHPQAPPPPALALSFDELARAEATPGAS
ncbi:DUF58 domain-containing protein [Lujinxingia litoralis]|nr:DUF58 domain-containing protein [Lujinxingia litoralis]